jgi:hypothetical protein
MRRDAPESYFAARSLVNGLSATGLAGEVGSRPWRGGRGTGYDRSPRMEAA